MAYAPTVSDDRATLGDGGRLSGQPSIELREVSKFFGEFPAVNDVSLDVRQGEFLTLLGPSGCGKTTTLRMIGGFELPTAGEILIEGEAMGDRPPYLRPVNTVFQNYALFPHMTVAQNVGYGLEMARVPKPERQRRVAEALERVMAEEWGMKVALGRAGRPEEVGDLIAFLLSERAGYLTGATINVDGGTDF